MGIEVKYQIGEVVWYAHFVSTVKRHPCPDCLGVRSWKTTSPAGHEYSFPCPRCNANFRANSQLSLEYTTFDPVVSRRTIGSIRVDTSDAEDPIEYMCVETGIRSGNIYKERDLYSTEAEAMAASEAEVAGMNATTTWVGIRFNESLRLCDYELDSAMLTNAKHHLSKISWAVQDLFDDLRACEDMSAINERIDQGFEKEPK